MQGSMWTYHEIFLKTYQILLSAEHRVYVASIVYIL